MKRTFLNNQIVSTLKVALLGMFLSIASTGWTAEEAKNKSEVKQEQIANGEMININTADENALDELPRIGPAIAKRILAYRQENGPFETLEELMEVKGIGKKTFEKLKPHIKI